MEENEDQGQELAPDDALDIALSRVADPYDRLQCIRELRTALKVAEEEAVKEGRVADTPLTWEEIGDALGIHRQNAHRKFAALTGEEAPKKEGSTRRAIKVKVPEMDPLDPEA